MFIFNRGPVQDLKRALRPDFGFDIRPKSKAKPADVNPGNSNQIYYYSTIKSFTDGGDYESGIKLATEAIKKFPSHSSDFNFWLGLNHYGYSTQFYNQNRLSRAQKELKKAKRAFKRARTNRRHDKYTETQFYLGVINERQGNQKKAARLYKRAITKEPDFAPALERLKLIDVKK